VRKGLTVLVALACVSSITVRAAESPESLQRIIKSLGDNQVANVEVFGAPEIIESNEALRADVLATVAKHRFSFSPGSSAWRTRFLVYALQGAHPATTDQPTNPDNFDLRWGCLLREQGGGEQHQIYLDGWKNEGLVDGRHYIFGPRLRTWFSVVAIGRYSWPGLSVWACAFVGLIAGVIITVLMIIRKRRNIIT
jgi:hypothetical protein